jgi:hypothetical protein
MNTHPFVTCSKCGRKTLIENRLCPDCGSSMWVNWSGADLARLFKKVESGRKIHVTAQASLWSIGKDFGFSSATDFQVPDLVEKGETSSIDVVWKSEGKIEFAFEIRIKPNDLIKPIKTRISKLNNLEAGKKFLVNVSSKSGKAYFIDMETYKES